MNMQAKIPKLESGKCAVVFAEKATGILLTIQGRRYLGEGDFYRVFDSEREADAFAHAYIQLNPGVECSIRDSEGKHLKFVSQSDRAIRGTVLEKHAIRTLAFDPDAGPCCVRTVKCGAQIDRAVQCRSIPSRKERNMGSSEINRVAAHYEHCWSAKGEPVQWMLGPTHQLPLGFQVLVFRPTKQRKMWSYATCGMSDQGDAPPLELHLFSPIEADSHVELLTTVTHYHLTGEYLDVGYTVNFGRAWLPGSRCDHGLISLPYLDGPALEWLQRLGGRIRFLWLVPVWAGEVEYKKSHGLEALEQRFESRGFNYLDPLRPSVV